jgi:translation initiation factor 1
VGVSSKKIPVSESQQPLAANPFTTLRLEGLPPGEEKSKIQNPKSKIASGRVVLRREKSQRGGKTVVVVSDFATHFIPKELEDFARRAKQTCGCGGTVAGREIELQGNDVARIRQFFEKEGFRVDGI